MPDEQPRNCASSAQAQDSSALISQPEIGNSKSYLVPTRPERVDTPVKHFQPDAIPQLSQFSISASPANLHYGTGKMEPPRPNIQANQPQLEPEFLPPLPPPPPPLSGLNLPPPPPEVTNRSVSSHVAAGQRHAFIETIDREQEELRDFRDEVLGSRFRLQAKRKELRNIRQETGAKDGSVFNLFRRYLHESNVDIPQDIKDAFNEASSLRDRLGTLEAEYDEAEANYNTLEWNYTRKESMFVDALLENNFVPNTPHHSRTEDVETAGSARFSGDSPGIWPDVQHTENYSQDDDLQLPDMLYDQDLTLSDHAHSGLHRAGSLQGIRRIARSTRRYSENSSSHRRSAWVRKMKRIDDWLLEMISNSPLQRAQLKAMYYLDYLDDKTWWDQVKHYWSLNDDREAPVFHTGDSTVSRRIASQHVSTSTVDVMGSERSAVKVGNANPLLSGDQVVDALEATSRPPSIEPGDLFESGTQDGKLSAQHRNASHETAISVSTGQTHSRRTSSSGGHATETTWDHISCSCNPCVGHPTQITAFRRERFVEIPRIRQESEQDIQSAPATPTQRGQDEEALTMPRLQSTSTDLHLSKHSAQTAAAAMTDALDIPQISESTSKKPAVLLLPSAGAEVPPLDPTQVPLPPSPNVLPSPMPKADPIARTPKRQCPISPLIRATGTHRWVQFPFPLLPLTSNAVRPCSHREHQLNLYDFPFVSNFNSHISFPGPTSDDLY